MGTSIRESPPVIRPSQCARVGSSVLMTTTSATAAGVPSWSTALMCSSDIANCAVTEGGSTVSTWNPASDDRWAKAATGTTVSWPSTIDVTAAAAWPGAGSRRARTAVPAPVTWTRSPVGSG